MLFDTVKNQELQDITQDKINKILSTVNINSVNDLEVEEIVEKDNGRVITTLYKPVSCILICKQEIHSSSETSTGTTVSFNENDATALDVINPNDNSELSSQPQEKQQGIQNPISTAVIYSVKILGVSISDFFHHGRSYRFKGIEFALSELRRAFNLLQKLELIKVIGSLDNEKRYTISDDSLRDFIHDLSQLNDCIMMKMNRIWMYVRKPTQEERKWLEKHYGYGKADGIIKENMQSLRSLDRANAKEDIESIESVKKEIEVFSEFAKKGFNLLKEEYKNTIEKYGYLVSDLVDINIGPNALGEISTSRKEREKVKRKKEYDNQRCLDCKHTRKNHFNDNSKCGIVLCHCQRFKPSSRIRRKEKLAYI
jgi:hypothetical protein